MDDGGRAAHGRFRLLGVRVQQRPPGDEAAHVRLAHGSRPAVEGAIGVGAGIAAEHEHSGIEVAAATSRMRSLPGIFSHVCADDEPRPLATATVRTSASSDGSSSTAPSGRVRYGSGSTRAMTPASASAVVVRATSSRVRGTPGRWGRSAGASCRRRGRGDDVLGVVGGQPVVELPPGTRDATPVHRADGEAAVQHPEEREFLEDVGAAQHTVHPRVGEGGDQPVQQGEAVRGGHRVRADRELAAGRVVGGDEEHAPVVPHERPTPPAGEGLAQASWLRTRASVRAR